VASAEGELTRTAARPSRRFVLALTGVIGAALVLMLASAAILFLDQSGKMVGLDLGRTPAPTFKLTDQHGQPVALEQFRGQPVVLTFLYTHCPDECPLIADQLRQTLLQLGPDAGKVAVLAVSTDPRHDDRTSVMGFLQDHQVDGRMSFLMGSPDELTPVWKAYYVAVQDQHPDSSIPVTDLIHSDPIYVIDKSGNERALLTLPFKASDLASDLRKLLKE